MQPRFGRNHGKALLLVSTIAVAHFTRVQIVRPPGYILNNQGLDGYTIFAAHRNSNISHLLCGDRGVIVTLLKKPMISSDHNTQIPPEWIHAVHIKQVRCMTYVASQKGFNGMLLLGIMLVESSLERRSGGEKLVKQWLKAIGTESSTSLSTGRGS